MNNPWLFSCCPHCGCTDDRIGHDDTCRFGCNDEELEDYEAAPLMPSRADEFTEGRAAKQRIPNDE